MTMEENPDGMPNGISWSSAMAMLLRTAMKYHKYEPECRCSDCMSITFAKEELARYDAALDAAKEG